MSALTQYSTADRLEQLPDKKNWTDAEFMALDRDGHRYELVNGELVDRGNLGAKYGYVNVILSAVFLTLYFVNEWEQS
jgi:Uma2 family endonuclease